jgi:two-component system chemotaxis response regulator CheB
MLKKEDFLVIIGASAGGLPATTKLLSLIDPNIDAAIGIVLHLPETADSRIFIDRLQRSTSLRCRLASDRLALKKGHVYLAPAGYHMLIKDGEIMLGNGPAEGRWRPSINASLRSAAAAWDSHSIGIVLTGMLDDGAVGMDAIRQCGGYTIVQDPLEADYPNMPLAVLDKMKVDACLSIAQIPAALEKHMTSPPARTNVPEMIQAENSILEEVATETDRLRPLGALSLFSCPECGGGLWEMSNGLVSRYRCHIGHGYTEPELLQGQEQATESTLWVALRIMEEKRNLLQKIAKREQEQGMNSLSENHLKKADELHGHIGRLKELIFTEKRTGAE